LVCERQVGTSINTVERHLLHFWCKTKDRLMKDFKLTKWQ
jgi:hypothetical protein